MKEALFYKRLKGKVQCELCPHNCVISAGKTGICGVRKNVDGKLFSLVYGKPCSVAVDPIEKKPLFHFLPGSESFSIGTVGCNLKCKNCQNFEISQSAFREGSYYELLPIDIVDNALAKACSSISYTYNEPTIFWEYVFDTAKLARPKGLKNVIVSNGFVNQKPLREWVKVIDAANIDLKGFSDEFYRKTCGGRLEPVLETLKFLNKNVWLEITNLVIPTLNDDVGKIKEMCEWIVDSLGKDVPLHFSRFFPYYKLNYLPQTGADTLLKARQAALDSGLKYVYVGNIDLEGMENTYCPKCGKAVIERIGFDVVSNKLKNGKCGCGGKIEGVWE